MDSAASNSVSGTAKTRAALPGLALVAVLLAVVVAMGAGPAPAGAATLEPCESTNPTGPIIELDGELGLIPLKETRTALRKSGVRQKLVKPAKYSFGRPKFPVKAVKYGGIHQVQLKGGLKLIRGKRSAGFRNLKVYVPKKSSNPVMVRAVGGNRFMNLFKVKGGKRTFSAKDGELSATGKARLTATAANYLNRKLKTGKKPLRAGTVWGYFNFYSLYTVTEVEDPTGETPEVPPVKAEPEGAYTLQGATTIKWYVRDTFIDYVASGQGTRVEDGATADPTSGSNNLVYSFNFPFSSGWTVPEALDTPENTLIKGSGKVGFQYCRNTINFTTADPEIEIDGDTNSRLIFHVNGTDGTPFPDQRAVMVKLLPSQAESHQSIDNGNGTRTVTWVKIPGFIPAEATGIFAGFYPAYSPDFEGQDPRPDRFGSFSVTYTYAIGS